MTIRRVKGGRIEFARIEPVEGELLKQVPGAAEPEDNPRALARLFPKPAGDAEVVLAEDWQELVKPELEHVFFSARRVVENDLTSMEAKRGGVAFLSIPVTHAESWLNALNQARLVLAAKHDFTDRELSRYEPPASFSRRDLVLLQVNFYAAIQERLIEAMAEEK